MKTRKVAPKNKVNKIKNRIYDRYTNLICIPIGVNENRNAIENMATVKQILNKNSKNLVSISYCDGMLFNRTFLNIKIP